MKRGKSSIKRLHYVLILLSLLFLSGGASGQFWSEDFNVGLCNDINLADTFSTANGTYHVEYVVPNLDSTHGFYVSSREANMGLGSCGNGCASSAAFTDRTLHLSTNYSGGNPGAEYDTDSTLDVIAYTPSVDCFGRFDLKVEFDYLYGGDTTDLAFFVISNAATPVAFQNPIYSVPLISTNAGACVGSGGWSRAEFYLPASFSNQPSLYFGFRFTSDGNSAGSGVSLAVDEIKVFETLPNADFFITQDTICDGNCVSFADSSAGNPTTYAWNFGPNASPSTDTNANPGPICFSGVGTNTVTLTVTNANGSSTISKDVTTITCQPPVPAIAASDSGLCQGQCIDFFNLSTNGSFGQGQWNWQFQGATPQISTSENPQNICYSNAGLYNITLTVTDTASGETATEIFTQFIEVGSCAVPTAVIESDTDQVCNNDFIEFYSLSEGIPDSVEWYFEGGNPTIITDTAHDLADTILVLYPTPGTFDVAIKVWNDGGVSIDTLFDYVTINDCPTPVPDFTVSDRFPCPGVPLVFEDLSQFATEWFWEFPGATPSTSTSPMPTNIVYDSAGAYTVTLTVTNVNGQAILIEEEFIVVDSCLGPRPSWSVERDSICRGTCVEFFNTSLRADSIIWIFWMHADTNAVRDTIDTNTIGYEWMKEDFPFINPESFFVTDSGFYPLIPPIINDSSPLFCFNDSAVIGVSLIAYNQYGVVAEHSPDLPILSIGGAYPTVDAGPEVRVQIDNINSRFYLEDTVNFEGSGTGEFFSWFPQEGLSCYDCPRPIVYPTETRKYYLSSFDSYGCQAFDSTVVFVEENFYAGIPNIFSPDGNNNNDILWLLGNGIAEEGFVMRVWDRYGNLVFESFSQNDGWDGTFQGTEMPVGSYTYYVRFHFINSQNRPEDERILTGNVTLVRY